MKVRTITWTMLIMLVANILVPTINMVHGTTASVNQAQTLVAQGSASELELTMILEKTVYRLGEPISITLEITNISNQTVTFDLGPDVNDFDFHVYNDTDGNVYWYSSIWVGAAIPMYVIFITLTPGDTWSENFVWQQEMLPSGTVSPGTYYIVGRVGPPYFFGEGSNLETTPIQIAIGPILSFRDWRYMGVLRFLEREDPSTITMLSSEPPLFLVSEKP
jgi:hypothetical protein